MKAFHRPLYTLALLALVASAARAQARIDAHTYRTPGGRLLAVYALSQGPGPFRLLDPVPGAVFCGPNRWVIPVPTAGLPALRFAVGPDLHTSTPIAGGGK